MGTMRNPMIGIAHVNDEFAPAAGCGLTPYDLYTADEDFLYSTAGGIYPIAEVDGRQAGPGSLGDLTTRVRDRYGDRRLSGPDVTRVW